MERIPLLAWIGIAIIVIFTLAINISLIALLRAKMPPRLSMRQPRVRGFIDAAQSLTRIGNVMRDPFAGERSQLNELSRLVHGLDQRPEPGQNQANANDDAPSAPPAKGK